MSAHSEAPDKNVKNILEQIFLYCHLLCLAQTEQWFVHHFRLKMSVVVISLFSEGCPRPLHINSSRVLHSHWLRERYCALIG